MPLILVTGISGAGKSTVCQELKSRGYEAYDSDEDNISAWCDNETGEKVTASERTPAFRARHSWKMTRARVEDLAGRAKNHPVFLCGVATNENEVWDLFCKVIALTVDENTLRQRIFHRSTNDFGKAVHEWNEILAWQRNTEAAYRQFGHIIIDATRPLSQVVDEVLSVAKENQTNRD